MGLFGFGSNKSKQSSTSQAQSFIDPAQQGFLNNIRGQAQTLNRQGMPVEGVASMNPTQLQAMDARFGAGGNMMGAGGMIQNQGMNMLPGQNMALNYSAGVLNRGPASGVGMALNTANRLSGMGQQAQPFVGQGLNTGLINQLAGQGAMMSAANVGPMNYGMAQNMAGMGAMGAAAQNTGINTGLANNIGGMTTFANAATGRGIDTGTANQALGMTTFADAAQNRGLNQAGLSRYINNEVISGQVDAASRDVMRNLTENQLTGNAAGAAATGNSGSSRRAVMDAIAQRGAADRVADISAGLRGNAYQQAVGLEAARASENAGFRQATNAANAAAANNMAGQGLSIAAQQGLQNVGNMQSAALANAAARNQLQSQGVGVAAGQAQQDVANRQGTNLANQSAYNNLLQQGFGFGNQNAVQNAAFQQQANANNQGAYNNLVSQGAAMSDAQLGRNLGAMNQASQFNAGQANTLLNAGASLGQGLRGQTLANQQFGATLANTIGQQGVGNIQAGANMGLAGANAQQGVGNELRAYEQQLLNNIYQQQMSPFNALNFYNQIVGAPTVLNSATSNSTGKSSGFNVSF
jgi:hypothetical protein